MVQLFVEWSNKILNNRSRFILVRFIEIQLVCQAKNFRLCGRDRGNRRFHSRILLNRQGLGTPPEHGVSWNSGRVAGMEEKKNGC